MIPGAFRVAQLRAADSVAAADQIHLILETLSTQPVFSALLHQPSLVEVYTKHIKLERY